MKIEVSFKIRLKEKKKKRMRENKLIKLCQMGEHKLNKLIKSNVYLCCFHVFN